MSDRIRGRIVRVVDGDTVTMRFADGTFTVRLWRIDGLESSQPYGLEAVLHLHKTGPYGRLIGEVEVWGTGLIVLLIAALLGLIIVLAG